MKKIISIMLISLLVLGGCGKENETSDNTNALEAIKEKGVLVVGTEGTYSPNSYHDENGDLVGFDVDVAKAIGKHLGVEVEFFEAEWDSLFAAMDAGRVDTVINEVEYDEERALKYDFSGKSDFLYSSIAISSVTGLGLTIIILFVLNTPCGADSLGQ